MTVRLIRAGHSPESAEQWAASLPMWATAQPAALDAFASAVAAVYRQRQQ